ncbi:MAG: ferrous iron transport protein A [Deltaproteobacteria bacterium]|nr:ferrous iron transport protein A [Deltaproteobacteria bacterium]
MTDNPFTQERLLAEVPPGRRVRIAGFEGGRMLRGRLVALGLNVGQEVEVLQNNRGLIILGVNGGRVALGRGVSRKILTSPVA